MILFVNLYLFGCCLFDAKSILITFSMTFVGKSPVIYVFTLIFVSVAPPPAPCQPVRGWSEKTTAKAADKDTCAGDGGDGEIAFDDSEGDDDDDDDDDSEYFSNPGLTTHRQC